MSLFMDALAPWSALAQHRSLTIALTKRDILGRYKGASFGVYWSLVTPLLMLLVYTLAFGYILKARWPGATGQTSDFALILFLGLIVHGLFAECLTRAPSLMIGNRNFVTKVVFPLEVLPWTIALSSLFHALAHIAVYCMLHTALQDPPPLTVLFLPLILFPLMLLSLAALWLFSAIGVFMRDITQVVGVVAMAMLFLSSAIVPVETLPAEYQIIFNLNPLTFIINQAREVAFWGRYPDWEGLAQYTLCSAATAYVAFSVFRKMQRGFADVL